MEEATSSRLQNRGKEIVGPAVQSARGKSSRDGSVQDTNSKVKKPESARVHREPQTARALLEENKQLVLKKKEEFALQRKHSREFIDKLLEGDQKVHEADKAKHAGRRLAQQELARYYKSKIAEKEAEKANSYRSKVEAGAGAHFFPYTEGEHINKTRKVQNALMREEMRSHLQDQRPSKASKARGQEEPKYESSLPIRDRDHVTGAEQPSFLRRPDPHMSRRIQDAHVRRALEDKVHRTKAELEKLTMEKERQAHEWEDGTMVNDALRYDATQSKSLERQKNAEFLRKQIEERRKKDKREVADRRSQIAGYWGPDEKQAQDASQYVQMNDDLLKQMEVNEHRKLNSRNRRLIREKMIVDNSIAEISQDRELERQKAAIQREVLVTTWDSQRKIREVLNRIEQQV